MQELFQAQWPVYMKFGMKPVFRNSHTLSLSTLCVNFGNWQRQLSHSFQGSYFPSVCSYAGNNLLLSLRCSLVDNAEVGVKVGKIGMDLSGSGKRSLDLQ